jgi:hypothetical protein
MRNVLKIIVMVAFLVGLGPDLAHASPIIDQQQPVLTAVTGFQTNLTDIAQTFTVGVSGKLDSISILTTNAGNPLTLDLLQTSGGFPTFTVLASAVAGTTGTLAPVTFDFSSSDIIVSVGDVLAFQPIVFGIGSEVGQALGFGADPDPYTRGEMFYNQAPCPPNDNCPPPTGGNWAPFIQMAPNTDLNFADMTFATTVDPVPAPASLLLFVSGLLGLGLMCWRKAA